MQVGRCGVRLRSLRNVKNSNVRKNIERAAGIGEDPRLVIGQAVGLEPKRLGGASSRRSIGQKDR